MPWTKGPAAAGVVSPLVWGALVVLCAVAGRGVTRADSSVDVPLSLWTNESYPNGLDFGGTMGVSFGDYDGDGFIDIFAGWSGNLWRNLGGVSWELAADLSSLMPPTERRYGSSFGDYDNDGFPDIAVAPRVPVWGDDRMHLLHNLGGAESFVDVAGDPSVVDVQPYGNAETLCWADVDGDANLDLFVPVYPASVGSGPGNFFLFNQGPSGPGGAYRFSESSELAGLDNPPGNSRPEGAQFADVDADGDVDLFSNGTLYQNVSSEGSARFNALNEGSSGIGLPGSLDEGAMFFDYDLDGDLDLLAVYSIEGVRIWENRGDSTFFAPEPEIIESPMTGLNLGMSAEDWDNDGDVDFTTRGVFRRNMLVETRARSFTVATTSIPGADLTSATPAWGDWDLDGDLDCALGNWGSTGRLYENTLYSPSTPPAEKRHVRVRVVRDSPTVPSGLETEYGAAAEVAVTGGSEAFRQRKFVASSHGYLNQNEYALHFALPQDPLPDDLAGDVHFDVSVDFPSLPANGLWRVDTHVNPVLGDIDLATLSNREIRVTRCGQVVLDGVVHDPIPLATPSLTTTTGGLALPDPAVPLPVPIPSPGRDWYTGLAFDTLNATQPLVVREILLDGQLDAAVPCGPDNANVALWEVTDSSRPVLVAEGTLRESTSSRNRRTTFPTNIVLDPGRWYRMVARVTEYRLTTIAAPAASGPITVHGGLSYEDQSGCNERRVAHADVDATRTALSIRYGVVPSSTQVDPVGSSLRLSRDESGKPNLDWQDAGAPGYQILRCAPVKEVCTPEPYASSAVNTYTDSDVTPLPGESFWYRVKAVNACTAGL